MKGSNIACRLFLLLLIGLPAGRVAGQGVADVNSFGIEAELLSEVPPVQHTRQSLRAALLASDAGYAQNWQPTGQDAIVTDFPLLTKAGKLRSVGAAFGMSAVVPGLGQAYNRHWGKAITAFVLEAAIITSSIVWRNQGKNLETDYQAYAHGFWSPPKYANWLNDYSNYIVENFAAEVTAPQISVPGQINFENPESWSDGEWQTVLAFFDQIQSLERQMFHVETLAAFSHTLPDFSEQQYYELVGKYYQFAPGWEDYPEWIVEGAYTAAIDPSMTGPDNTRPNVSDRFFQYADDHAHANDVLRRASRVTVLLLATHFVSAIEAAVSAKLHNDRLTPSMEIGTTGDGSVRPMASLRIKLP